VHSAFTNESFNILSFREMTITLWILKIVSTKHHKLYSSFDSPDVGKESLETWNRPDDICVEIWTLMRILRRGGFD